MKSGITRNSVLALIIINAITLGMETSKSLEAVHGNLLHLIDQAILCVFNVEITLRIIAFGPKKFIRSRWNVFDFIVIAISLVYNGGDLAILRTFRILRVLRLVSAVPAIRRVVNGLAASISSVAAVFLLLFIVFYVFAVIATHFYAGYSDEYFGSIGRSMFTLFQIMTLASWSDIARTLMKIYPGAWIFFIGFIVITTFTMLNLLVGIIVNTMHNIVHIEEEGYQGVERRKRSKPLPNEQERRTRKHVHADRPATPMDLVLSEERMLGRMHLMQEQISELKALLAVKNSKPAKPS